MALSLPVNQIIKQINLPLLLSIGIHGLFFAIILPQWNSKNGWVSSMNQRQNTPVIELNEIERTRIVELNKSQLPTLNWNIIDNLQESDNQTTTFNLPIPLPQNNFVPIQPNNLPSLPPLPPPTSFYTTNPTPLPLPNSPVNLSPPQTLPSLSNLAPQINQEVITNLPPISDTELAIENPQITRTRNLTPEEEAEIRQRIFANSPVQVTINPRDVINERKPQNIENRETNPNQNNLPDNNIISSNSKQKYRDIASELEKDNTNTSNEEANKNYVSWATEVNNVQPKKITLQGRYPKDACIRKLEGTTTYGVTVNNTGNVVQSKLIKSSGYGLFNNQALAQIKNYKFASNSKTNVPYHVYVNFKYDSTICPSLSVSDLGKIPPKNSVNPSPQIKKPESNSPAPIKNNSSNDSNPKTSNQTPTQVETVLPTESPQKEKQTTNKSESSATKKKETTSPSKTQNTDKIEEGSPVESSTSTQTQSQQKPQPTTNPNLPNSPANKAEVLVIPTESPKSNVKPKVTESSSQKTSPLPKIELNEKPQIDDSEKIQLIK